MPEGPELTYISTLLNKKLQNYRLEEIKSYTDKPVIIPKNLNLNPNPNKNTNGILVGQILGVQNKGKLLWLVINNGKENYYLHIHYGLTGWLEFVKPESNIKFEFIFANVKTNNQLTLYMEDKRRLSKVGFYTESEHNNIINKLGIDLFSEQFTLENFSNIIKNKNSQISPLLLKQEIFCGIGNYIKNESLYLSRINVRAKTSDLTDKEISDLYSNILFVGYSNLIEMLSDSKITKYLDKSKQINMPKNLEIPYKYKIYQQEKTPDGKKVLKIKVGGRDTYCIKELC